MPRHSSHTCGHRVIAQGERESRFADAVSAFQDALRQVAASQQGTSQRYGFPFLEPPASTTGDERKDIAQQKCIGAGIQY